MILTFTVDNTCYACFSVPNLLFNESQTECDWNVLVLWLFQ